MRAEILVGPERRRRWSEEEKARIVEEAFAPGACVAAVARRRGVTRSQVYQWRAALREGRLSEAGTSLAGFVPVALETRSASGRSNGLGGGLDGNAGEPPRADARIEVVLAGGRCLKMPASLPSAALRRLIRAVEGA